MLRLYTLPTSAQDILLQATPVVCEQAWPTVYPQVTVDGNMHDGTTPFMSRNGVLHAHTELLRVCGVMLPSETTTKVGKGEVAPEI